MSDLSDAMSKLTFNKTGVPYTDEEYVPDDVDKKAGKTITYTVPLPGYDEAVKKLAAAIESDEKGCFKTYEAALKDAKAGKDLNVMLSKSLALCKCLNDAGLGGEWAEDGKARIFVKNIGKHIGSKVIKTDTKLGFKEDELVGLYEILDDYKTQFVGVDESFLFEYEPKSRQSSTASQ